MVHDGDQYFAGGDVGQGCVSVTINCPPGFVVGATTGKCDTCATSVTNGYNWFCLKNSSGDYVFLKLLTNQANYYHTLGLGFDPTNPNGPLSQKSAGIQGNYTCNCIYLPPPPTPIPTSEPTPAPTPAPTLPPQSCANFSVDCNTCLFFASVFTGSPCVWCLTDTSNGICITPNMTTCPVNPIYGSPISLNNTCTIPSVYNPPPCPDNCSFHGNCINGTCICQKGHPGLNCGGGSSGIIAAAAGIGAGAIAGIIIGAIVVIVLLTLAGKKTYDWAILHEQAGAIGMDNALYVPKHKEYDSAMYQPKTDLSEPLVANAQY